MDDHDLERAVAAALSAGLQSPEDIADFVKEWMAPIVHLDVRDPLPDAAEDAFVSVRLTIARPTGALH